MAIYNFTASDGTELLNRINGTGGLAQFEPGDLVQLENGTYDLSAAPMNWSHGVHVVGAGPGATTIDGQFDTDLNGKPLQLLFDGVTIDGDGLGAVGAYGCHEIADGNVRFIDCEIKGDTAASAGSCITFASVNSVFRAAAIGSYFHSAERDVVSLKAPSGGNTAAASSLQLFLCKARYAGSNVNDQLLTPHDGTTLEDYGGFYRGAAGGQSIASDAPQTTFSRLYGTEILHEGGYSIAAGVTSADGVLVRRAGSATHDVQVFERITNSYLRNMEITPRGTNEVLVDSNELNAGGIHFEVAGTQGRIVRNLIQDYTATNTGAIWIDAVADGNFAIEGNLVRNCYRCYYFRNEGSPSVVLRDNMGFDPGQHTVFVFGATGAVDLTGSGYNHFHGSLSGYTALTGDIVTEPTPAEIQAFRRNQGQVYREGLLSRIRSQAEALKAQWRAEVGSAGTVVAVSQTTKAAIRLAFDGYMKDLASGKSFPVRIQDTP